MRRVGPQPPDPDWDRLDFRGLNGTRHAWGYINPTDEMIVTNDGDVYVKVTKEQVKISKQEGVRISLPWKLRELFRVTFRWVSIIKELYVLDEVPQSDVIYEDKIINFVNSLKDDTGEDSK